MSKFVSLSVLLACLSSDNAVIAKKGLSATSKKEIQALVCDVCKIGVTYAIKQDLKEDKMEDICEPKVKPGRWLTQIDISNDPSGRLDVDFMDPKFSKCGKECSVLAKACRKVFDDNSSRTERLAKMISKGRSYDTIVQKICNSNDFKEKPGGSGKKKKGSKKGKKDSSKDKSESDSKDAVTATSDDSNKVPLTFKSLPFHPPCHVDNLSLQNTLNRSWDQPFEEIDQKIAEMEDMMSEMKKKTGMGMKMYTRDELSNLSEGDMEAMAARESLAQERGEQAALNGEGIGEEM